MLTWHEISPPPPIHYHLLHRFTSQLPCPVSEFTSPSFTNPRPTPSPSLPPPSPSPTPTPTPTPADSSPAPSPETSSPSPSPASANDAAKRRRWIANPYLVYVCGKRENFVINQGVVPRPNRACPSKHGSTIKNGDSGSVAQGPGVAVAPSDSHPAEDNTVSFR
ncbi:hypothetical protein RIF29_34354 [Crotalaria pallida]|uniref:Uncharacterized protein n=1 Tax=Crotalaria pallida TaxID=3830 RepID=A0AAN9EBJ9_CROPI